jgi:cytochrome P450
VRRAAEPGVVEAPGGLPLVGHLAAFHRDRLGFLDACRATGGPVVRLRFARPTYLLLEPEDIGHVLVSYATYAKTDRLTDGRGQRAVGGGVLVAREGVHRDQRRTVRHVLSARRLERFGERVVTHTDRTIDGWRDGGPVDVSRAMSELARDVMLDVVFGADDAAGRETIFAGIAERRRSLDRSAHSPLRFPGRLPLALGPRRRRALEGLDEAIEARLQGGRDSVLSDLASTDDATPDGARDEAVSLGVAGYETVGQGLAWCLLAVSGSPDVLARLEDEVEQLGGAPPAASDLALLQYATACFEEAMRLRPPSWIVVRDVLREDTLPSGAQLARGARVYASQWVTHRDPRLHPAPERFDPERFLDGGSARGDVYAYFPFGAGPRDCIGRGLALLEGALVLARVVQRISLKPPVRPPRLDAGMVLRPAGGLPMVAHRRA